MKMKLLIGAVKAALPAKSWSIDVGEQNNELWKIPIAAKVCNKLAHSGSREFQLYDESSSNKMWNTKMYH